MARAQRAAGRRRRDRMGLAQRRPLHPRPVVRAARSSASIIWRSRSLAAAEAEDQLRPDPRPGHHPEPGATTTAPRSRSRCARSASGSSPRRRCVALMGSIPGEAVMGLVGPQFVGGTARARLPARAEVLAATGAVSESALVYIARHRNLLISIVMLAFQIGAELRADRRDPRARLADQLPGGGPGDGADAVAGADVADQGERCCAGCSARR